MAGNPSSDTKQKVLSLLQNERGVASRHGRHKVQISSRQSQKRKEIGSRHNHQSGSETSGFVEHQSTQDTATLNNLNYLNQAMPEHVMYNWDSGTATPADMQSAMDPSKM